MCRVEGLDVRPDVVRRARAERIALPPHDDRTVRAHDVLGTDAERQEDRERRAPRPTGREGHLVNAVTGGAHGIDRSEEHPSEIPSLMRTSYAVFCMKHKNN